jgi:hypothetical protein
MPKSNNPRPVEQDFTSKPTTPPPTPSEPPPPADSASASAAPTVLAAAGGGPPGVVVASGASGSVLVLLAAAAGVIVLRRRSLRRWRLTEGGPDERITGAWSEFTDALRLAGRPVPAHLAATEAAAYASAPDPPRRVGLLRRPAPEAPAEELPDPGPPAGAPPAEEGAGARTATAGGGVIGTLRRVDGVRVRVLGEASPQAPQRPPLPPLDDLVAGINTVGFAPGSADVAQAERAGRQVVAYTTALRERRSWWRRMWWTVNPGPLRWRRRD